jgi:hypothetical protein
MLYLVLVIAVVGVWFAYRFGRGLYEIGISLSEISRQLDRIELWQVETLDLICDAVDEFAVITGQNKADDLEQRMSQRLLKGRAALNKMYKDIINREQR